MIGLEADGRMVIVRVELPSVVSGSSSLFGEIGVNKIRELVIHYAIEESSSTCRHVVRISLQVSGPPAILSGSVGVLMRWRLSRGGIS